MVQVGLDFREVMVVCGDEKKCIFLFLVNDLSNYVLLTKVLFIQMFLLVFDSHYETDRKGVRKKERTISTIEYFQERQKKLCV